MKICHLGKFYPPARGGVETQVQILARGQAALGAEVSVVCVNHLDTQGRDVTWRSLGQSSSQTDRDHGVTVYRLGKLASFQRLEVCPGLPGLIRRLARDPEMIFHLHVPNVSMLLTAATCIPARNPIFVGYHSDILRQKVLLYALRPFQRAVFRRAKAIFPTSEAYAQASRVLAPYRQKLKVLPLGLELETFDQPPAEVREQAARMRRELDGPIWLCVGRLIYYKALDVALRALVQVPGTLLVVGTGPLRQELQKLAERLGVAGRVRWMGNASQVELQAAYRAATAFWLTSNERTEAFGVVQLEAMASGCPVINTAIPGSGVASVSLHMQTGLTVNPGDPGAFADAALQLLDNEELRQKMSLAGPARVAQYYSSRAVAGQSLAYYGSDSATEARVRAARA